MYHLIEFTKELVVDLVAPPGQRPEQTPIRKGTRRQAQLKPYVEETEDGFVEMADLFFEDGTATRAVPFAAFTFAD